MCSVINNNCVVLFSRSMFVCVCVCVSFGLILLDFVSMFSNTHIFIVALSLCLTNLFFSLAGKLELLFGGEICTQQKNERKKNR